MNGKTQNRFSHLISLIIHASIFLTFMFFTFEPEQKPEEFVTIGFGNFAGGNSGKYGKMLPEDAVSQKESVLPEEKEKTIEETKDVNLPIVKNNDQQSVNKKNEDNKKSETSSDKKKSEEKQNETTDNFASGDGESGDGAGSSGFEIAWGGGGKRKIYSYELPAYPDGVSKEIDIKLKFSILPDGSVGKIIPLMKADTRLEMAAINSLRNWRFEPLRIGQKKNEQSVVITFPYRLR